MPAFRLDDSVVTIGRYDVIGFEAGQEAEFVSHIAMSVTVSPCTRGSSNGLRAAHMVPPLLARVSIRNTPIHCYGTAELTDGESLRIATFIDEQMSQLNAEEARRRLVNEANDFFRRDQYTILPHVQQPAGTEQNYPRFSCAGFVIEAYNYGGISLLAGDLTDLPPSDNGDLSLAYGQFPEFHDEDFRNEKGIGGDGPWPVLLPGHVLNALNRPRTEIMTSHYAPKKGDEFFPSRRPSDAA